MATYQEPVVPDFWQLAKNSSGAYIDPWGPLDCTTHSAARAVMRHYQGAKPAGISGQWPPTGGFIRSVTKNPDGTLDRTGGTNHSQMQQVLSAYYGMPLDVQNGMLWADFIAQVNATRGAMISLSYKRIASSPYSGQSNFYGNHEMFCESVTDTTLRLIDPLADGRYAGVYHGPGDYPMELIKQACGDLVLNSATGQTLGYGRIYAAFTQATGTIPDPLEDIVISVKAKAEDWTPTTTALPDGTQRSNGVFRGTPNVSAAVLSRVPAGTVVRSINEIKTSAAADNDWRETRLADGSTVYMLRRDWTPVVPGGDPAIDAEYLDFILRK